MRRLLAKAEAGMAAWMKVTVMEVGGGTDRRQSWPEDWVGGEGSQDAQVWS